MKNQNQNSKIQSQNDHNLDMKNDLNNNNSEFDQKKCPEEKDSLDENENLLEKNLNLQNQFDDENENFLDAYALKIIKSLENICAVFEQEIDSITKYNFLDFEKISERKIQLLTEHEGMLKNVKKINSLKHNVSDEPKEKILELAQRFDILARQNQIELKAASLVSNKVLNCFRDKICEMSSRSNSYTENGSSRIGNPSPIAISTQI